MTHLHGRVKIEWQSSIMHMHVMGPFNLEGVNQSFEQIKQSVSQQAPGKWIRLDYLDEQTLGSPEVMRVISQSYKWCMENGALGIASVCSTSIQFSMLNQLKQHTHANYETFEHETDAIAWCKQQLVKF